MLRCLTLPLAAVPVPEALLLKADADAEERAEAEAERAAEETLALAEPSDEKAEETDSAIDDATSVGTLSNYISSIREVT